MVARKSRMMGRWPAAKALIVACGVAGCTSGPATVQTADQESSVSTAGAVETQTVAEIEKPTLRERWRYVFKKPVWLERLIEKEQPTPVDPFVVAHAENRERNAEPLVDYTPVVIRPVTYRETGLDWSNDVIRLDGMTPKWFADRTFQDATPVAVEGHQRGNPFTDAEASPFTAREPSTTVRPTSWTDASPTDDSARTPRPTRSVAPDTRQHQTISIQSYLNPQNEIPTGIVHGDMIIDSSLIPSKIGHYIRPVSAEIGVQQPIERQTTLPRRPFGEPSWEEPQSQPTASANQPVSVTPEIPRPAERVSFSSYRGRADRTPIFSGSDSFRHSSTAANPFAAVEGMSVESSQTEIASHPSAPVVAGRPAIPATPAVPVAAVANETISPLANALDLSGAKQLAREKSKNPAIPQLGTPLAVGLGFAAVVVGGVMIRGRLA